MSSRPTSVCFCNNRGGVGKTFMTFQIACAAAHEKPDKKFMVMDFSVYAELTAALLGDKVSRPLLEPPNAKNQKMIGVEALARAISGVEENLTHFSTVIDAIVLGLTSVGFIYTARFFFMFFASIYFYVRRVKKGFNPKMNLVDFAIHPHEHNAEIPKNVFLVPSTGGEWRTAEGGIPEFRACMGETLANLIGALGKDFDSVFIDTDHVASACLTRLALSACDRCVVPCPTDTAEFRRLYRSCAQGWLTGVESLFTDVMLPMMAKGALRARVSTMIFSKVPSAKNVPVCTEEGASLPFTPNTETAAQMDRLATFVWEACESTPRYRALFLHAGGLKRTFIEKTFTAFKTVPDLPKNISVQKGVPICTMTTNRYDTSGGVSGATASSVLVALQTELRHVIKYT
jgi:cellulose biosynthesis protein BcsQ